MSHGDQLSKIPAEFHTIGFTESAPFAAIAHDTKPFYGIQFHPEVTHSPRGREVIGRFVLNICKCSASWTMVFSPLSVAFCELISLCVRKSSLEKRSLAFDKFVDLKGGSLEL